VEEEFLLLDSETGSNLPVADEVIAALPSALGRQSRLQLRRSMVEMVTPVCTDLGQLREQLVRHRRMAGAAAATARARLVAVGATPVDDPQRSVPGPAPLPGHGAALRPGGAGPGAVRLSRARGRPRPGSGRAGVQPAAGVAASRAGVDPEPAVHRRGRHRARELALGPARPPTTPFSWQRGGVTPVLKASPPSWPIWLGRLSNSEAPTACAGRKRSEV
jgi:hypothetical protein